MHFSTEIGVDDDAMLDHNSNFKESQQPGKQKFER